MKIKSDIIWAGLLIGTAAISIYLGARGGTLQTEETLREEIEERDEKIRVLEEKINQLSDELTSRGIFSFPQAIIVSPKKDKNPNVVITLNGREKIEDLVIKRKFKTINENSGLPKDSIVSERTVSIGTLNAHNPVSFEIENFPDQMIIELYFKSGKDSWRQYILARKTSMGEIKTFWVITNSDSQVIDKHIDEGFPSESDGISLPGEDRKIKYSEIRMNSSFVLAAE